MVDTAKFDWYADASLFADLDEDENPFGVNPPDDLTADATPLKHTESYLYGAIVKYVNRVAGGEQTGIAPMVDLAIEETYARLGYPHSAGQVDETKPYEGPSHAELRELPDPTPQDFRDTLSDICDEPEEYARKRQVAERTSRDARQLNRLLPKADQWDLPGETDQNGQSGQIDQSAPANESAESDSGISNESQ